MTGVCAGKREHREHRVHPQVKEGADRSRSGSPTANRHREIANTEGCLFAIYVVVRDLCSRLPATTSVQRIALTCIFHETVRDVRDVRGLSAKGCPADRTSAIHDYRCEQDPARHDDEQPTLPRICHDHYLRVTLRLPAVVELGARRPVATDRPIVREPSYLGLNSDNATGPPDMGAHRA